MLLFILLMIPLINMYIENVNKNRNELIAIDLLCLVFISIATIAALTSTLFIYNLSLVIYCLLMVFRIIATIIIDK